MDGYVGQLGVFFRYFRGQPQHRDVEGRGTAGGGQVFGGRHRGRREGRTVPRAARDLKKGRKGHALFSFFAGVLSTRKREIAKIFGEA